MRHLILLTLLTLAVTGGQAADKPSPTIATFNEAMAGDDSTVKKQALRALTGSDDVILPLLIQALGDRQIGDLALTALRSRTGLTPPANKRVGGPGYPGYPADDSAGSWSGWLSERTKDLEQKKLIKDLKDKDKKPDVVADEPVADAAAPVVKAAPTVIDADLGAIDRIILKTGGALRCYVLSKRTDVDGNLLSVRIAHPDGGGEEVLQADLIARLEEDVQ